MSCGGSGRCISLYSCPSSSVDEDNELLIDMYVFIHRVHSDDDDDDDDGTDAGATCTVESVR